MNKVIEKYMNSLRRRFMSKHFCLNDRVTREILLEGAES